MPVTAPLVELSRSEVARVADVLAVLVAQHGRNVRAASAELGLRRESVGHVLERPASLRLRPDTLEAFAKAAGCTVEQLRRGEAPLPPALPGPAKALPRLLVRHATRDAR